MKCRMRITTMMLFVICSTTLTFSQYKTEVALEADPSAFLLKGYSFHIRVKPASWDRWLIGAGTYGLDLPEMIANLNPDNRDEGWEPRIKSAYALFAEFYFKEANKRWFVGEQVGIQNFRVKNDAEQSAGSATFSNALFMTYLGYSWHPYKGSFYIKPWVGLGYTKKIDGTTTVGSMAYDVAPLFPFFTFHVGYHFGRSQIW